MVKSFMKGNMNITREFGISCGDKKFKSRVVMNSSYKVHCAFNKFPDCFFVQAFKIVIDS